MKNWIWGIIIVLIVGFGAWGILKHDSSGVSGDTIKIGLISPLSGDAAAYGEMNHNGMAMAVDEINKAGGIGGKQIEAIYEDGKCNGQDASSAAQKLVNTDGVKYIVGGGCSGETFAIYPISSVAKVLLISPSASAPKLATLGPYFLRNNPSDNIQGTTLADYLSKHYKNAAVISEKTDYAQGIKGVFLAQAQKDGLNIVAAEDFESTAVDFRTILTKIKSANPEVIFINPQAGANVVRIATQARQLGIKAAFADAAFTGTDVLSGGSAVEGLVAAVPPGLASEGKGAEFLANYKKIYKADPTYAFYAGAAYDDIYLIKQGIEAVGNDATKVAAYLHSLPSYTGTLGTYSFDENGDLVGIVDLLQKITNGKAVTISD